MKVIFIDVDGTLVAYNGIIPESAVTAIQKARAFGHKVLISTGRSMTEIYQSIREIGFDGYISAGGGYIEVEGKPIYHKSFSLADIQEIVEYFNTHGVDYYLETNNGLYATEKAKNHLKSMVDVFLGHLTEEERKKSDFSKFIDILIVGESLIRSDINKIVFLGSDHDISLTKEQLQDRFVIMEGSITAFGKNSGELMLPNISKSNAIKEVLDHLGLDQKDTLALGDGLNDLDMLEFAEVGIAMGNAKDDLKAIADDVTDNAEHDGIYNSFVKYKLI